MNKFIENEVKFSGRVVYEGVIEIGDRVIKAIWYWKDMCVVAFTGNKVIIFPKKKAIFYPTKVYAFSDGEVVGVNAIKYFWGVDENDSAENI